MEQIMSVINIVIGYIPWALTIIGAAAVISTKTANKADDKIVQLLLDIVNFLAMNLGKSKNA